MSISATMNTRYFCKLVCILICGLNSVSAYVAPYDLEVIPASLPPIVIPEGYNKHVPRKIWMAVKDIKDDLPGHIQNFLKRNALWEANICDNDCKDKFMNTTFAGTNSLKEPHGFYDKPIYFTVVFGRNECAMGL